MAARQVFGESRSSDGASTAEAFQHGFSWTREQLAFVLKLSVVGVRKMEHQGTTPVKSLESRRALLELAKTLENPGAEICAYIEAEEAALG